MIPFSTWIVWQLRKISYRWYARYQALKAAKVGKNTYKCAVCGKGYKKEKRSISLDHITPVKDPAKPQAFQEALASCTCGVCEYLRKMFCGPEGYQVLCKSCHDQKTKEEMEVRKEKRREQKKLKGKKTSKAKEREAK